MKLAIFLGLVCLVEGLARPQRQRRRGGQGNNGVEQNGDPVDNGGQGQQDNQGQGQGNQGQQDQQGQGQGQQDQQGQQGQGNQGQQGQGQQGDQGQQGQGNQGQQGQEQDSDEEQNAGQNEEQNNAGDVDLDQFCPDAALASGKTLTAGQQLAEGSFSNTIHGFIPSTTTQVKITEPDFLQIFDVAEPITFRAQATEYALTVFTDANTEYYKDPISLEGNNPIGHVHFTCELMEPIGEGANGTADPVDGTQFDFFKGVNEGSANNLEAINEEGFSQPGLVRCCILPSSGSHQCLVLPELNRPPEMDCTYVIIREGGEAGEPDDLEPFGLFRNVQFQQ